MVELEKRQPQPEGCLTAAIRIPVRIVVLLVVLPLRMVWDVLAACGRGVQRAGAGLGRLLHAYLVAPLGHAIRFLATVLIVWPCTALYRYLLTPLGHAAFWLARVLVAVPAVWVYRWVLTPLGHGVAVLVRWAGIALRWLGRAVFVWPWVALWRYVLAPVVRYGLVVPVVWVYRKVLTPVGHGLGWTARGVGLVLAALGRWLFVVPVVALWRYVLAPAGRVLLLVAREIADAVGMAWRAAGHISRAVGRALKWLGWHLVGRPVRRVWQAVLTPVGHWVRDSIWRPARKAAVEAGRSARTALRSARESVRQTRRDAWRALVGGSPLHEAGEPVVPATRTLGGTTTVPDEAPEPEISLLGKKTAEQG